MLDILTILQFFEYDREGGKLIWKRHWHKNKLFLIGKVAGVNNKLGYRIVRLNNINYPVHRLIYFLENEKIPIEVDHIDGNPMNNHFSNLRSVTSRKNHHNLKSHREGKLVGASWHKGIKKWTSQIKINGKLKHLGCFDSELDAHLKYVSELYSGVEGQDKLQTPSPTPRGF